MNCNSLKETIALAEGKLGRDLRNGEFYTRRKELFDIFLKILQSQDQNEVRNLIYKLLAFQCLWLLQDKNFLELFWQEANASFKRKILLDYFMKEQGWFNSKTNEGASMIFLNPIIIK